MPGLLLSDWVSTEHDRIVGSLFEWLRIPSISAHPDRGGDVLRSAELCAVFLRDAGLEHVCVLPTAAGRGAPAVYGDWLHAGDATPTVLVYGHHDVQPVDPVSEWTSPPFEPVIVDGECRARGAIDDKGQVLYQIEAARGTLNRSGKLPVNLKFLIEGEEESGSPNFEALLVERGELFRCDIVVVSDTGMVAPDIPSVCVGMRGLVGFDVTVRTSHIDLHSGMWGGAVPNAARVAAELAAQLHDADGRVNVPGFYDRVRTLAPRELRSLASVPFDEATFKRQAGVAYLQGEAGHSTLERIGTRPTAELVGISSGYQGEGIKTIVPAWANLKLTFRLVPDQTPVEISGLVESWIRDHVPAGTDLTVTSEGNGVAPALTPVEHPAIGALSRAISKVWAKEPLFTREGGSGPEEALGRVLRAPILFLGVGLPDDRIHAPNERMVMDQFWKGLLAAGELLQELGGLGRPEAVARG
jgi:acetylornithine deacetylase/succinyl-diaminopimelate desuccinylase-like protein